MSNNLEIRKKLKNAEGKRLLEINRLEYTKTIIEEINKNPGILDKILENLGLTENDFFSYISGKQETNITFYDQVLKIISTKNLTK